MGKYEVTLGHLCSQVIFQKGDVQWEKKAARKIKKRRRSKRRIRSKRRRTKKRKREPRAKLFDL